MCSRPPGPPPVCVEATQRRLVGGLPRRAALPEPGNWAALMPKLPGAASTKLRTAPTPDFGPAVGDPAVDLLKTTIGQRPHASAGACARRARVPMRARGLALVRARAPASERARGSRASARQACACALSRLRRACAWARRAPAHPAFLASRPCARADASGPWAHAPGLAALGKAVGSTERGCRGHGSFSFLPDAREHVPTPQLALCTGRT